MWLDRGELDKIIERSTTQLAPALAAPAPIASFYEQERGQRRMQQDQPCAQASQQPYRKKKKESWLSEIFD